MTALSSKTTGCELAAKPVDAGNAERYRPPW